MAPAIVTAPAAYSPGGGHLAVAAGDGAGEPERVA
jgi:hypothetical protein